MTRSFRVQIKCPHCGAYAMARTSREQSKTLREITYQCSDVECGHTYVANLEIVRTLSPSAKPNAAVRLPISAHTISRVMQQLSLI